MIRPTSCPEDVYEPVCSCYGDMTYDNSCLAAMDGVAHQPGLCAGDACSSSDECTEGTFCDIPGCTAETGICEWVPMRHTCDTDEPVCGCDGYTYGSACEANSYSVSVSHDGSCSPFR